jgi:hypothetical protein
VTLLAETVLGNKRLPFGLILAGILVMGAFAITTGGGSSLSIQAGTVSCIVMNTQSCTTQIIPFSPAYSNRPVVGELNVTHANATYVQTMGTYTVNNNLVLSNPSNSTILAFDVETATTITVPAADTILRSWNPSGNSPWSTVIVEGEGYITTTALTAIHQDVSIMVEDCTLSVVYQTIKFNPESVSVGSKIPFAVKGVVPANAFAILCVSIDVQAPAADANTSITLVSFRAYGRETNFETWINMPASKSNLYSPNSNNAQEYTFTGNPPVAPVWNLCANIVSLSTSINARLYVNATPGGEIGTGALRLNVGSGGAIGFQCITTTQEFTPFGTVQINVEGLGGAGTGDLPAFGAITLTWTQSYNLINQSIRMDGHPQIISLTAASFRLRYTFPGIPGANVLVTFNWQSIGT